MRHIAALAYQLPTSGRTWRAIYPQGANSIEAQLLREVEHNQRLYAWARSKEAKNKETAPQPMQLPGEEEAYEIAVNEAEHEAARTAELLGIKL